MTQIENASASGSSAVAQASLAVASGTAEVALALGVDKPPATKLCFLERPPEFLHCQAHRYQLPILLCWLRPTCSALVQRRNK